MQLATEASVCEGSSIQLQVSGANKYQWINNTSSLSNSGVANPVAKPDVSTMYTVVGADANNCFKDTTSINVIVRPLPIVDAGPGTDLLAGASYQLQPVVSNDVTSYQWSPSKYLSCSNCLNPLTTPLEPMLYTLSVRNGFGCISSNTVTIRLLCSESRIFIPNSFTPNNDTKNDPFIIKGQGIKLVKSLRIYNRWGELIFERKNFFPNDINAAWDGKYGGQPVPAGNYVYIAELSCNEHTYMQKGTVLVIY